MRITAIQVKHAGRSDQISRNLFLGKREAGIPMPQNSPFTNSLLDDGDRQLSCGTLDDANMVGRNALGIQARELCLTQRVGTHRADVPHIKTESAANKTIEAPDIRVGLWMVIHADLREVARVRTFADFAWDYLTAMRDRFERQP